MSKPKSYREPTGDLCRNCATLFSVWDYDEPEYYFCLKDAPPRPHCGSVGMCECFCNDYTKDPEGEGHYDPERTIRREKAWGKWAKNCGVSLLGTCDSHERRAK